jgi:hypothetical protein
LIISVTKEFASQTLGLEALQLSIEPVTPGLASGASGAPVCRITDKNYKKLVCVVKANGPEYATKEINALRLMKKQNMKNCYFPEVMGIGKSTTGTGDQFVLLAQSPAKGLPIDKYIEMTGQSIGIERKNNAKTLREAVTSMAKGISEMHNKKARKGNNHFEAYRAEMIQNIDKLLKNPLFNGLPLADMRKKFSLKLLFEPMATFTHGAFHPGNVFYSENDSFLTLIDNDGVLDSVIPDTLNPKGTASCDFSYCYQWIVVLGSMKGLTDQEIGSLVKKFEEQYILDREVENKDDLKKEINFMKAFVIIKYISDITDALTTPDHHWYKIIGEKQLKELKNLLIKSLKSNYNTL